MSGIAERLAEVLAAALQDRANRPTGYNYLAPYLTDALLPVVEREIAAARGEALREAADAQDAMCDTYRDQTLPGLATRRAFANWLRDEAALSPDPDRGEGEVDRFARIGYGICPKCNRDKFIGHGPLCAECFTGRCDSVLVLRHGSAACDLAAGHEQPHGQDASGRTWTTEQAAASAEDET